jgi:hypothetical protein
MMLRLEAAQSTLRIEVEDADPRWALVRRPLGLDETGFGFVLIRAVTRKWGVRDTAAGKAIWAELATSPGGEAITTSDDGLSQAPQRRTSWRRTSWCAPR